MTCSNVYQKISLYSVALRFYALMILNFFLITSVCSTPCLYNNKTRVRNMNKRNISVQGNVVGAS
jgi:hypothetical protein